MPTPIPVLASKLKPLLLDVDAVEVVTLGLVLTVDELSVIDVTIAALALTDEKPSVVDVADCEAAENVLAESLWSNEYAQTTVLPLGGR